MIQEGIIRKQKRTKTVSYGNWINLKSCEICDKSFSTSYNLSKHMMIHTKGQPFSCRICKKPFTKKDNMINHMETVHSKHCINNYNEKRKEDRPKFYCDICGKPFLSKFNLNQHSITHSGQKNISCDICEYKCYTKSQLDVHKAKHNKRFCCEKCSKMFVYRFQLETHLQSVHYNLRPYKCELCDKYFKTKYNLGSHMAMHKNIRNFHCLYCTHKCRTSYDLKIHIRTHTREKPYGCSICGRCFNQKGDRAKHEKLHTKYQNKQEAKNITPVEIYIAENSLDDIVHTEEVNLSHLEIKS